MFLQSVPPSPGCTRCAQTTGCGLKRNIFHSYVLPAHGAMSTAIACRRAIVSARVSRIPIAASLTAGGVARATLAPCLSIGIRTLAGPGAAGCGVPLVRVRPGAARRLGCSIRMRSTKSEGAPSSSPSLLERLQSQPPKIFAAVKENLVRDWLNHVAGGDRSEQVPCA